MAHHDPVHTPSSSITSQVSTIVVTYNSKWHLPKLCASIQKHRHALNAELIVVDNASRDQSATWCRENEVVNRVIANTENRGFAAAANQGARAARGNYLLFCNPDLQWLSPIADILVEHLRKYPRAKAATARLEYPDGRFQANCRRFPTHGNILFSRKSPLSILSHRAVPAFGYTLPDYPQPVRVDAASATCLLVEREAFEELGGFDERFFMFVEDTDFCLRLAQHGYDTWFVPAARAVHEWGGSSTDQAQLLAWHTISIERYFRKHYPRATLRNAGLSVFLRLNCLFRRAAGRLP